MSKTPEEMAEEYVEAEFKGNGGNVSRAVCKHDFMSGYKAAIDLIHNNTTKEMSDLANAFAANYFGKEYAVSFDSFLAGYQATQQWISVEDRLPDKSPMVLAMCTDGYELAYYGMYGGGWTNTLGTEHLNVTHWQPLPAPPKEDK